MDRRRHAIDEAHLDDVFEHDVLGSDLRRITFARGPLAFASVYLVTDHKIRTLLPRCFLSVILDWPYVLVLALPTLSSLGLTFALCTALLKHRLVALRGEVPARPSRLDLFPRATCDSVAAK